jgi:hypothetical protein
VAVDLPCTAAGSLPAAHGHLVGLRVRVLGDPAITAADFRFVGADGVTVTDVATASAKACLDEADSWPSGRPGPERPVPGTIVLDVSTATGTVVYKPASWPTGLRWHV